MSVGMVVAVGLVLVAVAASLITVRNAGRAPGPKPFALTGRHYGRFYSRHTFFRLGGATVLAAVLAHTGVDEAVDRWHAGKVRGAGSDRIAAVWKGFGEPFWFFVWAVLALLDGLVASHPLLRWGRRNFEAMVVGLPMLWTLQRCGGASRPSEERGAAWRPMKDDNTASGHTFMAAVPWLSAGASCDRDVLSAMSWLASWGTGWSRMNDRKHYLSQVLYGHAIAATAVEAVQEKASRTDP